MVIICCLTHRWISLKNAEPRLRAYVIFPGDMFKGREIEIRAGIYTGATPIKPFFQ